MNTELSQLYRYLEIQFHLFINSEVRADGQIVETRKAIGNVNGYKFEIYPNDHNPPHFHVVKGEMNSSFKISNCEQTEGPTLKGKELILIKAFWEKNKEKIEQLWNSLIPSNSQKTKL